LNILWSLKKNWKKKLGLLSCDIYLYHESHSHWHDRVHLAIFEPKVVLKGWSFVSQNGPTKAHKFFWSKPVYRRKQLHFNQSVWLSISSIKLYYHVFLFFLIHILKIAKISSKKKKLSIYKWGFVLFFFLNIIIRILFYHMMMFVSKYKPYIRIFFKKNFVVFFWA
jgi:hypothetical protein